MRKEGKDLLSGEPNPMRAALKLAGEGWRKNISSGGFRMFLGKFRRTSSKSVKDLSGCRFFKSFRFLGEAYSAVHENFKHFVNKITESSTYSCWYRISKEWENLSSQFFLLAISSGNFSLQNDDCHWSSSRSEKRYSNRRGMWWWMRYLQLSWEFQVGSANAKLLVIC